jgi:hypothetical protein
MWACQPWAAAGQAKFNNGQECRGPGACGRGQGDGRLAVEVRLPFLSITMPSVDGDERCDCNGWRVRWSTGTLLCLV